MGVLTLGLMATRDSLTLLETPYVLDALAGISEHEGFPLLEDDVCLWVGGDALDRVTERADILPFFPILEPADLWATSGIVIYERGTVVDYDTSGPHRRPGEWIAADQWWAAPSGLAVMHFFAMTIPFFLSALGIPNDLRECVRMRGPGEFDRVYWKPKTPSERNSLVERPGNRFATPESRPLLIAAEGPPVMWEWGLRCEVEDKTLPDRECPLPVGTKESAQRGAPLMDRAAETLNAPARTISREQAAHFARLWTIMQAAAAPASHLPRRVRRSLDRSSAKMPSSRSHMNNLWVVDLPRPMPDPVAGTEPAGSGGKHSHRYPVRGHWRQQWYPSVQSRKPIWIDEHTRGSDSSPFHDYRAEWERDHPIYRLRVGVPPPPGGAHLDSPKPGSTDPVTRAVA